MRISEGLLSPKIERIALIFCLIAGLVPIWAVARFPSVDGPMHLYVVHIFDQLAQPGTNAFDRVFEVNRYIEPNSTIYALLWGLIQLFPAPTAEKIFISGYWLLFAGSAFYALRAWGRRSGVFAFLLLPFALGYFLHWGFYNFILSQALFLLAAGYALRHLDDLRIRHILLLALLMLLLAVTHLVGIAMFLFFIGLTRTGIALRKVLTGDRPRMWKPAFARWLRDAMLLFVAALPAIAIVVSFLLRRVLNDAGGAPDLSLLQKIFYVTSAAPIFALDKREAIAFLPFVLVLWGSIGWLLWRFWKQPDIRLTVLPPAIPMFVLGIFVLLGSLGFAGFEGLPRLLPFFFFMAVIAVGAVTVNSAWRGAIITAVCVGLLATSVVRLGFYRQANALYAAFEAAHPAPPPGSAFVAFNTSVQQREIDGHPTGWRMNISDHFRTAYAREKGLLLLTVPHFSQDAYGYFPVTYRRQADVSSTLSGLRARPSPTPLDRFERLTGMEVQGVAFWPHLDAEPGVEFILPEREVILRQELAREWRLLPRNHALDPFLYVERDPPPASPAVPR